MPSNGGCVRFFKTNHWKGQVSQVKQDSLSGAKIWYLKYKIYISFLVLSQLLTTNFLLKLQKFIVSWFWMLKVQNQGASRAMLPLNTLGRKRLCFSSFCWPPQHSVACSITPFSAYLRLHMTFSSVSVYPFSGS